MTHHPVAAGAPAKDLALRQGSTSSTMSDDAVLAGDPKNTTELLSHRLSAWKHAVDYLVNYVEAAEKSQKSHAKEYEKMLKTISSPLKQGDQFDPNLGGITGLFENLRTNTQALVNAHHETGKNIGGSVVPILERLHKEIKAKSKELTSGAAKGVKAVDKARNETQKHIELLGQHAASYETKGGKGNAIHDPYVLSRGVQHRLHQQVLEENTNRHDIIAVQKNFAAFEGHIVEVIQQALASFDQFVRAQAQREQTASGDVVLASQKVTPNFEWDRFAQRNAAMLIDPASQDRTMESITYPNQDHAATKPLIAGTLERKSRNKLSMTGYSAHYYVVTPAGYLHEFKDNDNLRHDPEPEMSIYLPGAMVGASNGEKFNVKGKDVSKGLTSKLSGTSEVAFKAQSAADAQKWYEVIRQSVGAVAQDSTGSAPTSPLTAQSSPQATGLTGATPVTEPVQAQPAAPVAPAGQATHTAQPTMTTPAAAAAAPVSATTATAAPVSAPTATGGGGDLAGDKL